MLVPSDPIVPPAPLAIILLDVRPGDETREWRFTGDETICIGRAPENAVQLSHPEVSRVHVAVFRRGLDWECCSLGRYGTYLDGRPIRHTVISHGMVLQCTEGGPRLEFRLETWCPPPKARFAKETVIAD